MPTANRMTEDILLSPLRLLASVSNSRENSWVRDRSSITSQNFSDFLAKWRAEKLLRIKGSLQWLRQWARHLLIRKNSRAWSLWGTLKYLCQIEERSSQSLRNLSSCEKKAWKKFRLKRDSNPWPLRCRCSALPTELSSQLGAQVILWVRNISFKPKFFSGYLFATALVA